MSFLVGKSVFKLYKAHVASGSCNQGNVSKGEIISRKTDAKAVIPINLAASHSGPGAITREC